MAQNYSTAVILPGSPSFFEGGDNNKERPKLLFSKIKEALTRSGEEEKSILLVSSFWLDDKENEGLKGQLTDLAANHDTLLNWIQCGQFPEDMLLMSKLVLDNHDIADLKILTPKTDLQRCTRAAELIFSSHTYKVGLTAIDTGFSAKDEEDENRSLLKRIKSRLQNLPPSDGLPVATLKTYIIPKEFFYHGYTTRTGGVSTYPSMRSLPLSMSLRKKDTRIYIEENRRRLAEAEGFAVEHFEVASAVHGIDVWVVGDEKPDSYDAIVTDKPGVTIAAPGADCQTLLFCDPVKKVVGAAHSGWKGTIDRIQQNVVRVLKERFECDSDDIRVAIGPSIGVCCYKVGEELAKDFEERVSESVVQRRDGVPYLDLWLSTRILLKEVGIKSDNIDDGDRFNTAKRKGAAIVSQCTACNKDKFFSYRRDGPLFGNQVGFIGINNKA